MSDPNEFSFVPDNGDVKFPSITSMPFKPEGCELYADTPLYKFTPIMIKTCIAVIANNFLSTYREQCEENGVDYDDSFFLDEDL